MFTGLTVSTIEYVENNQLSLELYKLCYFTYGPVYRRTINSIMTLTELTRTKTHVTPDIYVYVTVMFKLFSEYKDQQRHLETKPWFPNRTLMTKLQNKGVDQRNKSDGSVPREKYFLFIDDERI